MYIYIEKKGERVRETGGERERERGTHKEIGKAENRH